MYLSQTGGSGLANKLVEMKLSVAFCQWICSAVKKDEMCVAQGPLEPPKRTRRYS